MKFDWQGFPKIGQVWFGHFLITQKMHKFQLWVSRFCLIEDDEDTPIPLVGSIPWQLLYTDMDVSENSGFSPQIIHFNGVFHYFHHPFWGVSLFLETPISKLQMDGFKVVLDILLEDVGCTSIQIMSRPFIYRKKRRHVQQVLVNHSFVFLTFMFFWYDLYIQKTWLPSWKLYNVSHPKVNGTFESVDFPA